MKCIGCGFCCSTVMCRIGTMLYGNYTNPCPALKKLNSKFVCSLYLNDPLRYEDVLEIGQGCCFPASNRRREWLSQDSH